MPREFHAELEGLDQAFRQTTGLVAEVLLDLAVSSEDLSASRLSLATRIVDDIDSRCRELEDGGHILLARQAPVGGDLRRLIAILRQLINVERAARHTRHVLDGHRNLDVSTLPADVAVMLAAMGQLAAEVFAGGLGAWSSGDALAVNELDAKDRDVDALHLRLLEAASHSERIHGEARLSLGSIARHYERIADYGVSLAKDAAFVVTGDRVTN
jgi:phosphate transport system protein